LVLENNLAEGKREDWWIDELEYELGQFIYKI